MKRETVTSQNYPEIHVITIQSAMGFMMDEINLVTPNARFVLMTVPVGCDAVLNTALEEFKALTVRYFILNYETLALEETDRFLSA